MHARALTSGRGSAALKTGSALLVAAAVAIASPALADRIPHPTAVFAGLDKITGRIIAFEAAIDETVQFGSLQITPRVCFTRPATEAPLTTGFVEVEEVSGGNEFKRIFGGWMFAASPGLHAIEHPVYDAWLTDCKGGKEIIPDTVAKAPEAAEPAPAAPPPSNARQRRQQSQPQQQARPQQQQRRAPELGPPVEVGAAPGGVRPPANIPRQEQRRAPSQQFYPTNRPPPPPPPGRGPFGLF